MQERELCFSKKHKKKKREVTKPIDDLYMGGFPGGGAPVGFRVG